MYDPQLVSRIRVKIKMAHVLIAASLAFSPKAAPSRSAMCRARPGNRVLLSTVYSDRRGNLALLNADEMLAAQAFPLGPDELIARAKDFIEADYGAKDTSLLSESFTFVGPFVGPLTRQQYLDALGGNLNPSDGFPDLVGNQ